MVIGKTGKEGSENMGTRSKNRFATVVGKRLREARKALDMQQSEVARALGITMEAYGSYERGWHTSPTDTIGKVPAVLHRPLNFFLGLPDDLKLEEDERMLLETYRSIQSADIRSLVREMVVHQAKADERIRGIYSQGAKQAS